jgi:hypothetical protein
MLNKLQSTDFAPFRNTGFRIEVEDLYVDVELIDVRELGSDEAYRYENEPERRRPFSIVFRGPADSFLPQRIYHIVHPDMGTLDLFLVPIGPDREGMLYEAVFS